jgi:hypothetical protein
MCFVAFSRKGPQGEHYEGQKRPFVQRIDELLQINGAISLSRYASVEDVALRHTVARAALSKNCVIKHPLLRSSYLLNQNL